MGLILGSNINHNIINYIQHDIVKSNLKRSWGEREVEERCKNINSACIYT